MFELGLENTPTVESGVAGSLLCPGLRGMFWTLATGRSARSLDSFQGYPPAEFMHAEMFNSLNSKSMHA